MYQIDIRQLLFFGLMLAYDLVQRISFSFGAVQNQNDLLGGVGRHIQLFPVVIIIWLCMCDLTWDISV